jgi:diguanylate cyclase (GGDEF)-like protein/PAS domain S-box-containing protein
MRPFFASLAAKWPGRLRKPGLPELVCATLALACLILPEWWALSRNRLERQKELRALLSSQLEGTHDALEAWAVGVQSEAVARASQPELQSLVTSQTALATQTDAPLFKANLLRLRQTLTDPSRRPESRSSQLDHFLVVAGDGRVVGAANDDWVGRRLPIPVGSTLHAALQGEAVLTAMGSADPNLVLEETELETCILVAAPVRNAEGRVLAALAYRLEVLGTLRSLIAAANGRGGARLHAYSSSGEWVADLSLHPAARLTDSPRPLQTPVQDLLARIASGDSGIPVPSAPALMLTRSLVNVEGYRGREGQWVVGAASAAGQVGVGLVAEMDGSDAYRSVYRARWTLIGLAILLGFSLLLVILNQTSGGGVAAPAVTSSARNTAAWAILAVSIVATGITWWATKSKVDQYDRTRFEQEAAGIREDLLERVRRYAESLRSVKASFEAFGAIDAVEWSDFVGSLDLAETFPGLSYIAFVQNVEAAEMEAFQASFGAGPGVPYRPYPQVSRPLYFPIRYMAPMARNLNEVGFDVASSQALRAVLEQARDSGQITVSGIVDEALLSGGETGVLMLDPVYRPDSETQNRANRRKAIVGWVAAFLRTSEMIKNVVGAPLDDVDLEVFDGSKLDRRYLLYDHDGVPQNETERGASRFQQALLVDVGGRPWTLFVSSISGFDLPITQNHPAQVLVGGLAISVLLFDIALVLSSTRSRALAIAELMTRKVRESEARVRAVIDCALDGIITFDEAGNVHTFNPGAEKLFGRSAAEAQGLRIEDLLPSYQRPSGDAAAGASPWARHLMQGPGRECVGRRSDGATFPAELTISRVQTADRILYTAIVRDISERKAAEEALRESEARYALAARAANDGLWDWNLRTDSIYYAPRWKAMLGIEESAVVDTPEVWFHRVHEDDRARLQANLQEHLDGHTSHFESEHRVMHRDGSYRWMLSRGIAVRDESGLPIRIAGSQTDITARKQAERQLLYDALHDPLTGLPNRNYFMGQLERAAKEGPRRGGRMFGILFLDIDRFKLVNDSLGHLVGDQLLVSIADRLKICLRPGDTIARLGGDEFAILIENLKGVDDATHIAERIQKELALPFRVAEQDVFTSASIGITLNNAVRGSAEELLRDADTAMYRAKAQGRARYELFNQGMHTRAIDFLRTETALRRALERNELLVHYQPIVSLETGEIIRCEALIRWQHPERGLVLPGEFIPLAEETGLILPMSGWLLRTAFAQVKAWQDAGLPRFRLAVNISPRQLKQENLFNTVSHALFEADLGPESLELELTESALMESTEETIKPLVELFAKGVQISLDDFGTGYSSLMYLRRFPISNLKIDASFVRDITTDPGDAAIASGLIALAHSLDLRVTAEGVETMEQLEFLRRRRCDHVQGHVISPPLSADKCTELLRRGVDASLFANVPQPGA